MKYSSSYPQGLGPFPKQIYNVSNKLISLQTHKNRARISSFMVYPNEKYIVATKEPSGRRKLVTNDIPANNFNKTIMEL